MNRLGKLVFALVVVISMSCAKTGTQPPPVAVGGEPVVGDEPIIQHSNDGGYTAVAAPPGDKVIRYSGTSN
jgi:hypothetical protein